MLDEIHSCYALLLKNEGSRLYFISHAGNLDAFPIIYLDRVPELHPVN